MWVIHVAWTVVFTHIRGVALCWGRTRFGWGRTRAVDHLSVEQVFGYDGGMDTPGMALAQRRGVVVAAEMELDAEHVARSDEREEPEHPPRVDEIRPDGTREGEHAQHGSGDEGGKRDEGNAIERVGERVVAEVEERVREDPGRHHESEVAGVHTAQVVPEEVTHGR